MNRIRRRVASPRHRCRIALTGGPVEEKRRRGTFFAGRSGSFFRKISIGLAMLDEMVADLRRLGKAEGGE